jgi:hypothetical protein
MRNFALENPLLNLVLLENLCRGSTLSHLDGLSPSSLKNVGCRQPRRRFPLFSTGAGLGPEFVWHGVTAGGAALVSRGEADFDETSLLCVDLVGRGN